MAERVYFPNMGRLYERAVTRFNPLTPKLMLEHDIEQPLNRPSHARDEPCPEIAPTTTTPAITRVENGASSRFPEQYWSRRESSDTWN